ncbi:MAG: response regulator, partial [Anaerolineales bacterium]|nr:response regulator [Anaerolineales bacterium]
MNTHPKATLLIVDDLPANLHFLRNILVEQGYKVRIAADGEMALQSARSALPDLILLDVMLPQMDGYAVCTQLKADPQTRHVPVIFLSALNESLDKVKAFTVGGVDYITKPFQVEEVIARVETHLSLRRLQASLEQQIAELDAFAHTVAHDLKSPLGVLLGYTDILSQELAVDPHPLAQEYLKGVVRSALKMDSIVDELLLLARVRKVEQVAITSLDMAAIVTAAQERLAVMIVEYEAEIITPTEWPTALGYRPWVEEIWANYISNAIKYGGQPPCLELGADIISSAGDDLPEKRQIRFWVA